MKKKLKQSLDLVIKYSKSNSFYTKKISWKKHLPIIYSLSREAQKIEDLIPSFDYIFNLLDDNHAHIRYFMNTEVITGYRAKDERINSPMYFEHYKHVIRSKFKSKTLENNVGYLRIPAIHPKDKKKQAEKIRKKLIRLSNQNTKNWIIDLRYNTGGHIESMGAALSPLFKDGLLAKVIADKNKCIGKAKIKNRKFTYFNINTIKLPKQQKIKANKIVVLTSKFTASSGELFAIFFKGRKGTHFIGEPTAGKTTNTSVHYIKDLILLIMSKGRFADRNNTIYPMSIPVDTPVEFDPFVNFDQDPAILKAHQWFEKSYK